MRPALLVPIACLLAGSMLAGAAWAKPPDVSVEDRDDLYRRLKLLAEAIEIVQRNYVEPVKGQDLVYGAVEGILARLDPHSSFLTPEMFQEMQVETEGAFGGLGIEVSLRDGVLTVVSPIEDSPAFQAGILPGDVIVMIEEEATRDMSLGDAVKKMRGAKGTKITIRVMRKGFENPKPFTLIRDVIRIKSVKGRRVENVGVVRVAQFQQGTHVEVREAVKRLAGEGALEGLVLDLRNNPGGLLDQAVKVADIFLKKGTVVSTRGRDPDQEVIYTARDDGDEPETPLVVVVNEGTASASEIVAGALQDHRRALVLGERTFGKGSVQTILPLEEGAGIRITTALYYTPGNRSIQAKGISPDVKVASTSSPTAAPKKAPPHHEATREEDLKGHFGTPKDSDAASAEDSPKAEEDIQVQRAIELLKAWKVLRTMGGAPAGETKTEAAGGK